MSDLPFRQPPSINEAVQEHLNVIHEVRELRRATDNLENSASAAAIAMTQLAGNVGRLADALSALSLSSERLDRRVTALERKVDTVMQTSLAIARHLGVPNG